MGHRQYRLLHEFCSWCLDIGIIHPPDTRVIFDELDCTYLLANWFLRFVSHQSISQLICMPGLRSGKLQLWNNSYAWNWISLFSGWRDLFSGV